MTNCNNLTDSGATFNTTDDGLAGVYVSLVGGTGVGQVRRITSNTSNTLTLESDWTTNPDSTTTYNIAAIPANFVTAEFSAQDWGLPVGSTLDFNAPLIIECDEQASVYTTGKVVLTNGSATVTGVGTTWVNATHRGHNFFIKGYDEYEHFISSVESTTSLTLTSAWAGQTGQYKYAIGAKLLKMEIYLNGDHPDNDDDPYRTFYMDMATNPAIGALRCKGKSIVLRGGNNRVAEPFKLYSLTLKQPSVRAI